jgi:hypothetical protein
VVIILVANGEATPNNPIDFKSVNFPEEMRMAVSTFEMMLQDLKDKQDELS